MGHDSGDGPPATATAKRSALSADEVRAFADRAPRCKVSLQVLCTVPGTATSRQILEAELVNVSSSGMLLASAQRVAVGAVVEFEFKLDDGRWRCAGRAEVVRTVSDPPRMGLRFVTLDGAARSLVQRLIEAGDAAPEVPTAPGYAPPAVEFDHGSIRVRLTAATATFFTYNPLLHVGVRGCFLPAEEDVPLGHRLPAGHPRRARPAAGALQGEGGGEAGSLDRAALPGRRPERAAGAARGDREAGGESLPARAASNGRRLACWSSLPHVVSGSVA